jgi:hypothetical protein
MVYSIIAFFAGIRDVMNDAHELQVSMSRKYGWMPE